jgi:D-glycero-beta-D-manno-heptose-7-phosphate kinase
MDHKRADKIINDFAGCRIIVLGDLMLDEFVWGEVRRISPEAPVPIVEVERETWSLGGAANVVANLLALGVQPIPIGIVGADGAAQRLRNCLIEAGAETSGVLSDQTRPTTYKTRILAHSLAHSQQMIRADRESRAPITRDMEDRIISVFNEALNDSDAVIISDYDKGLLTPRLLSATIEASHKRNKSVSLDPKIKNFQHYRHVDYIKPNHFEAERITNIEIIDENSVDTAARQIREMLDCKNVLITRGQFGMSLLDIDGKMTHIPAVKRQVYDVTGAGDTVIAVFTLALASGAELEEAAIIANHAAGVVVSKVGTATLSAAELSIALLDIEP